MPITIAGILGIEDSEETFVNTVGQQAVFDAVNEYAARLSESLNRVTGLFVERTTEDYKWRYYLPGDRELQTQGGMGRSAEQKGGKYYDVALPIFQFGDALGGSYVETAYMTIADVEKQMVEMRNATRRTLRRQILTSIFNNEPLTFDDIKRGQLTVLSLANQDGTLYPPLPGYDDLAQAQHYLETGYLVSAIDDTHNVIKVHADVLLARYPDEYDGIVFIGTDQVEYVKGLTGFMEVGDPRIIKGGLADRLTNLPGAVPGKIIGRCEEMWVAVWPDIPPTYSVSIAPSAEKPLQKRIDPAGTNLPSELTLVKQSDLYPLEKSDWMWRFGMGVVNRLNGVVVKCAASGAYSVPAKYARL